MRRYTLIVAVVVALLTTGTLEHGGSAASRRAAEGRYQNHSARWWAGRAVHNRRRINALEQALRADPQVVEAINSACATYGNCALLWRRAECESHLNPRAHNRSGATGLFQFLPSTWATTPYARMDINSPYASALAAGWMETHGRGNEWVCR